MLQTPWIWWAGICRARRNGSCGSRSSSVTFHWLRAGNYGEGEKVSVLQLPLSSGCVQILMETYLSLQVCGSPDIPLHLLKSVATYKGVEPTAPLIQWFWEVMESFSNTERSLFLRFVWGRTRLPRTIADFRGRDFVVQVRITEL